MKKIFTLFTIASMALLSKGQCDTGEIEVGLNIYTDDWGYEVYWEIVPDGSSCGENTIAWGGNDAVGCSGGGLQNQTPGGYANNSTITEGDWCLVEGASYNLTWVDDWGDGGASFDVVVSGVPVYTFEGGSTGDTWSFVAQGPADLDAGVINIESYSYVTDAVVPAICEVFNYGSNTITEMELQYSVNGSQIVTETFSGISIPSYNALEVQFVDNLNLTFGSNDVEIKVFSLNGEADEVPSNDSHSKEIIVGNPIPNVIDGYIGIDASVSIMNAPGDQVSIPRDLDFHPVLTRFELWVINKGTENSGGSTVRFDHAGFSDQDSEYEQDGNAWHFMSLPTGIAFGENENFANSPGVLDANHDGGTPFTGPALWSSDPDIYAEPSGGNGSHLDMLHVSPYSQGIAHEIDNVYWVTDGYSNDVVRYDFVDDHGPGNSYHGDAIIHRYADFSIEKDPGNHIVSHCVLDKSSGWLYLVDHGNDRVLRMDINSGEFGGVPSFGPFETIEEYLYVIDYEWEEIISSDLVEPAGIDIIGDRLLVSDHATGEIIIYDLSADPVVELDRLDTGSPGVMGIKIGPWGRIWFVNATTNEVGVMEGNPLVIQSQAQPVQVGVYPNPAHDELTITLALPFDALNYSIVNILGETVTTSRFDQPGFSRVDISDLPSGQYIISVTQNGQLIGSESFIKH